MGEPEAEQKLHEFMKFGLNKKRFYWHEFVMDGYANHEPSHIYLTGLPDRPESLPHNKKSKITFYKVTREANRYAGLEF